jgi:hypothetical protein
VVPRARPYVQGWNTCCHMPSGMDERGKRVANVLLAALIVGSGCASTRTAEFGRLPNNKSLVTLTVSEDRDVVRRECQGAVAPGPILGCRALWPIVLGESLIVQHVKIVRYTDALPSAMAFEIDIHELCHAVAALQQIEDPCHVGNHGLLRSSVLPTRTLP